MTTLRIAEHIANYGAIRVPSKGEDVFHRWLHGVRDGLRSGQIVRLDATNVAEYIERTPWRELRASIRDGDGFVPPWPQCWIEFVKPTSDAGNVERAAILVECIDLRERESFGYAANFAHMNGAALHDAAAFWWGATLVVWVEGGRYPEGPVSDITMTADERGCIADHVADTIDVRCPTGGACADDEVVGIYRGYLGKTDDDDAVARLTWAANDVALFAFRFANCRNVERVEVLPNRQYRRASERRGDPVNRHYVLAIDANTQRRVYPDDHESQRVDKRLHICRGHFATYTDAAPLFGKHVGRFWVPAHVRGTSEKGIVAKDYAIGATA